MGNVRRIYVEKKRPFAVKAAELHEELKNYLGIDAEEVRILIRYDVENLSDAVFERACTSVFSEPPVDDYYLEQIEIPAGTRVFSVEFLPGQFDQRADSAVQCVQFLNENENPTINTAVTYLIRGQISDAQFEQTSSRAAQAAALRAAKTGATTADWTPTSDEGSSGGGSAPEPEP